MIVLVAHITAIVTVEHECDSPVLIDVECPLPLAATLELVEPKTRGVEVTNIRCDIEPCQNSPNLGQVIRVETSRIPSLEESFQTSMLETDNHQTSVTRNVSGVKSGKAADSDGWTLHHYFTAGWDAWRRGRDSHTEGQARGCSETDHREATHGPRERSPVFRTVSRLPNQTTAD